MGKHKDIMYKQWMFYVDLLWAMQPILSHKMGKIPPNLEILAFFLGLLS